LLEKSAGNNVKYMRRLIDQLKLPFQVISQNGKHRVVFDNIRGEASLYSGSCLTTLINCLANILIGMAIADCEFPEVCDPFIVTDILRASILETGYIVTMDYCEYDEDLQFLKHSPILTTSGHYQPMLNLGVLLRASGSCKGDVPGRGDLSTRFRDFQASLLQGMYPRSHCLVVDNMKRACGGIVRECMMKTIRDDLSYKVDDTTEHTFL
jgi:hypothetical protein